MHTVWQIYVINTVYRMLVNNTQEYRVHDTVLRILSAVFNEGENEHYNNNIVTILTSLFIYRNGKCFPRRTSRYDAHTGDARSISPYMASRILQNDGLPVMLHGVIMNPSEHFLTCVVL